MSFSSLEHAIQWLQENTASHWRQDLQRYFDHQYKYIEEFTVLCHRQKSCLALDLIYPILRHRRWLNTPMFADILTLSCSHEYKLPRAVMANLVKSMIDRTLAYDQTVRKRYSSREFLTYIFVMAATTENEKDLVAELGLGTALLTKMKFAAERIDEDHNELMPFEFTPEIELVFSELILDLGAELSKTPWALDIYRLGFEINELPKPFDMYFEESGAEWIFHMLLRTGSKEYATLDDWQLSLKTALPVFSQGDYPELTLTLLNVLVKKNLLFRSYGHKKNQDISFWNLTPISQGITARAFAARFWKKKDHINQESLLNMNPYWLKATIELAPEKHHQTLERIVNENSALHPDVLAGIIRLISGFTEEDKIVDILKARALSGPTPWIRRAACEILGTSGFSSEIGHILLQVAESDLSTEVRSSAIDRYLQIEDSSEAALANIRRIDF